MKKWILVCCLSILALSGCGNDANQDVEQPSTTEAKLLQLEEPKSGDILAQMKTSVGTIQLHLFPKQAPKAVENFVTHAKEGYYDNLSFHRVIKDFMIQGGDPNGNGTGGESIWNAPFEDEFSDDLYCFNGALAMANSGKDTNGSQFFIVQNQDGAMLNEAYFKQIYAKAKQEQWPNAGFVHPENVVKTYQEQGGTPHLDHMHTVFGQVIEGMDVVEAIASAKTDPNNRPLEAIVIESITIEEVE